MKKFLCLILVAMLLIACCSCSPSEDSSEVTLTIWAGYSLVGDSEIELSQDEWIIKKLIKEYEKNTNGVKINYVFFEDESVMQQMIKTNANTDSAPDMFVTLSGRYLESYEGMLLPLNQKLPDDLLNNMIGWESVKNDAGEILGVPAAGCDATFIAYNKSLISQAGLDYEINPPKTKDEIEADLQTILNKGIQPIIASDEGWNSLHSTIFGKWWLQQENSDIFEKLTSDAVDFEKDLPFIQSYTIANDWYNKGYINNDFVTNEDSLTQFLNGECAFYISSSYVIDLLEELGDDLGVIPIPDYDSDCNFKGMSLGGSSQCVSVLNTTKNEAACIDFLSWLFQKENSIKMQQVYSGMPGRVDISAEDLGWDDRMVYQKLLYLNTTAKPYPELILNPDQTEVYFVYGPEVIVGNMTPLELAARLNQKRLSSNE